MTCREVGLLFGITVGCGVVGGSFTAIIQQLKAVGLIIDSEAYEMPEPEATALNLTTTAHDSATHGHDASEEWFPEDGAERHLCTWAADMLICWVSRHHGVLTILPSQRCFRCRPASSFSYCTQGFALMLVGCYFTALGPVGGEKAAGDLKQTVWGGVCWGMAGFVIFGLATGLGLPPELPGPLRRCSCLYVTARPLPAHRLPHSCRNLPPKSDRSAYRVPKCRSLHACAVVITCLGARFRDGGSRARRSAGVVDVHLCADFHLPRPALLPQALRRVACQVLHD